MSLLRIKRAMIMTVLITACLMTGAIQACRHAPANDTDTLLPAAGPDTVRGVISIVGNEPQTTVSLTATDNRPIVVRGDAAATLRAVNSIEVTLFGAYAGTVSDGSLPSEAPLFVANAFLVRAVQGVAASDGVLVRIESGFALQHVSGLLSVLRTVPEALQTHVGARIFWVGAYDAPPAAYGVITPGVQ